MNDPNLIILADDVTGAADSAARCVGAGLTATIDLAITTAAQDTRHQGLSATTGVMQNQGRPSNVLACSTDSRFLAPAHAAARVESIVRALLNQQEASATTASAPPCAPQWYKKIDSTLRGNLGTEIAALLPLITPANHAPHAIIAPAFPAQQRTLVDGYLCYTQLPPRTRHLPTMLTDQCSLTVTSIPLKTIRAGTTAIATALQNAQATETTLIVADAESEEDLANLYWATTEMMPHALFCGSAGLVGVMAQQLVRQKETTNVADDFTSDNADDANATAGVARAAHTMQWNPMLVVVGSGSPMAHQQLDYLRQQPAIAMLEVDPAKSFSEQIQPFIDRISTQECATVNYILHLPKPNAAVSLEGAVPRQLAAQLAAAAEAVLNKCKPPTVLIVGGDTATHLLERLGIHRLHVIRELLPGMPVAIGITAAGRRQQIILKAGNHGDMTTLATLLQWQDHG